MNKKLKLWVGVGSFILVGTSLGVTSSMAEDKLTKEFVELEYPNLIADRGEDGEGWEKGEDGEDWEKGEDGEDWEKGEDGEDSERGEDGED